MSFADEACGVSIASGASVLIQGRWSREGGREKGSGLCRWRGGDERGEELRVELVEC